MCPVCRGPADTHPDCVAVANLHGIADEYPTPPSEPAWWHIRCRCGTGFQERSILGARVRFTAHVQVAAHNNRQDVA